jgi:CheY-like chemotaxis protein
MEAVGRLAGGIAHDINNVLMIIRGHTDMAREQVSSADPLRRDLDQIQKASDRATALVQQLLAFGRRQLHRPRILDINMVVADLGKMLAPLIGEDIKLRIRTNAVRGHVKADPGQVEQVLMNLATNARDAMPRGGELVIETANADGTDEFALRALGARPGPWVRLAVSDTGCGMSAEVKSHLFEPFFTTKSPHKGSGLGLATVYGIIKQSGGHVWVESEVGRGTTFAIYLAQVEGVPEPAVARPSADAALRGSETILLVEDDDGVRQLVREMLVRAGYTVLEANYGEAALKVADEHQGQIHLLLTDVVMPGMSGRELADHLRARREGVKVCFMSGYPGAVLAQQGVLEPGTTLLQKPFVPAMLTGKLRELLDAPSAYR